MAVAAAALFADVASAQTAPSHAPVITRPVIADFTAETFTFFWGPPAQNTGAPITGYRIFREQTAGKQPTAHPTVCDSANFSVSLENHAFTLSDQSEWFRHTAHPLGNPPTVAVGSTHGNCYRWKIAAVNEHGTGPAATTAPILARGFVVTVDGKKIVRAYDTTRTAGNARVPCADGEYGVYGYKGNWGVGCAPPEKLGQAETCHALRDRNPSLASAHRGTFCGIEDLPASSTICSDLEFTDLGEVPFWKMGVLGTLERCQIDNPCGGTFSEYNTDYRECLCTGWATPKASGSGCECNTAGADSNCECPGIVGRIYLAESNACGCATGEEVVSELGACYAVCEEGETRFTNTDLGTTACMTPDSICATQGWAYDSATGKCQVPVTSAGTDYDGCFVSGASAPQCDDVFGESFAFPASSTVVWTLYNAFDSRASNTNPAVATAMGLYRDAVVARHNGDPDYLSGPIGNLGDHGSVTNRFIAQHTQDAFAAAGITFDEGANNLANEIRAAFSQIPIPTPFVFNCGEGATPATANTIGATQCQCGGAKPVLSGGVCVAQCPQGELADAGVCRTSCSTGSFPLDGACVSPAEKCEGRGWSASTESGVYGCAINFRDAADAAGAQGSHCGFALCDDYFGPDLEFPQRPADGSNPVYIYNCDPDGTTGLVPVFADGSTECRRRSLLLRLRLFLEGPLR